MVERITRSRLLVRLGGVVAGAAGLGFLRTGSAAACSRCWRFAARAPATSGRSRWESGARPTPMGASSLTPMKDAAAVVEFYRAAFGAVETDRVTAPTGQVVLAGATEAFPDGHHWLIGKPLEG